MSVIHYKFKSSMEYDTLTFDGLHISLADLKKAIREHKKLKTGDFHLQITDAQTKQPYILDSDLIPKNASVIVTRKPIGGNQVTSKIVEEALKASKKVPESQQPKEQAPPTLSLPPVKQQSALDIRLEALLPAVNPHPAPMLLAPIVAPKVPVSRTSDGRRESLSEEDKIMNMVIMSGKDYDPSTYAPNRGRGRRAAPTGPPSNSYQCFRCGQSGHYIEHCVNQAVDEETKAQLAEQRRVKTNKGIPLSFMTATEKDAPGAMLNRHGVYMTPIIDKLAYENPKKERPPFVPDDNPHPLFVEKPPIPGELVCPICKDLLREAVVIPCCGTSFCDNCVRNKLLESEEHLCPMEGCGEDGISPDSLIPNKFLRTAVTNFLNETGYTKAKQQAEERVKAENERRRESPMLGSASPSTDSGSQPTNRGFYRAPRDSPPKPFDSQVPVDLHGLPPQVVKAEMRKRQMASRHKEGGQTTGSSTPDFTSTEASSPYRPSVGSSPTVNEEPKPTAEEKPAAEIPPPSAPHNDVTMNHVNEPASNNRTTFRSTRRCYMCNEEGHIQRDCPQNMPGPKPSYNSNDGNQRPVSGAPTAQHGLPPPNASMAPMAPHQYPHGLPPPGPGFPPGMPPGYPSMRMPGPPPPGMLPMSNMGQPYHVPPPAFHGLVPPGFNGPPGPHQPGVCPPPPGSQDQYRFQVPPSQAPPGPPGAPALSREEFYRVKQQLKENESRKKGDLWDDFIEGMDLRREKREKAAAAQSATTTDANHLSPPSNDTAQDKSAPGQAKKHSRSRSPRSRSHSPRLRSRSRSPFRSPRSRSPYGGGGRRSGPSQRFRSSRSRSFSPASRFRRGGSRSPGRRSWSRSPGGGGRSGGVGYRGGRRSPAGGKRWSRSPGPRRRSRSRSLSPLRSRSVSPRGRRYGRRAARSRSRSWSPRGRGAPRGRTRSRSPAKRPRSRSRTPPRREGGGGGGRRSVSPRAGPRGKQRPSPTPSSRSRRSPDAASRASPGGRAVSTSGPRDSGETKAQASQSSSAQRPASPTPSRAPKPERLDKPQSSKSPSRAVDGEQKENVDPKSDTTKTQEKQEIDAKIAPKDATVPPSAKSRSPSISRRSAASPGPRSSQPDVPATDRSQDRGSRPSSPSNKDAQTTKRSQSPGIPTQKSHKGQSASPKRGGRSPRLGSRRSASPRGGERGRDSREATRGGAESPHKQRGEQGQQPGSPRRRNSPQPLGGRGGRGGRYGRGARGGRGRGRGASGGGIQRGYWDKPPRDCPRESSPDHRQSRSPSLEFVNGVWQPKDPRNARRSPSPLVLVPPQAPAGGAYYQRGSRTPPPPGTEEDFHRNYAGRKFQRPGDYYHGYDPHAPNRNYDDRYHDPRNVDPRNFDPRNIDPRNIDPRNIDPRFWNSRPEEHGNARDLRNLNTMPPMHHPDAQPGQQHPMLLDPRMMEYYRVWYEQNYGHPGGAGVPDQPPPAQRSPTRRSGRGSPPPRDHDYRSGDRYRDRNRGGGGGGELRGRSRERDRSSRERGSRDMDYEMSRSERERGGAGGRVDGEHRGDHYDRDYERSDRDRGSRRTERYSSRERDYRSRDVKESSRSTRDNEKPGDSGEKRADKDKAVKDSSEIKKKDTDARDASVAREGKEKTKKEKKAKKESKKKKKKHKKFEDSEESHAADSANGEHKKKKNKKKDKNKDKDKDKEKEKTQEVKEEERDEKKWKKSFADVEDSKEKEKKEMIEDKDAKEHSVPMEQETESKKSGITLGGIEFDSGENDSRNNTNTATSTQQSDPAKNPSVTKLCSLADYESSGSAGGSPNTENRKRAKLALELSASAGKIVQEMQEAELRSVAVIKCSPRNNPGRKSKTKDTDPGTNGANSTASTKETGEKQTAVSISKRSKERESVDSIVIDTEEEASQERDRRQVEKGSREVQSKKPRQAETVHIRSKWDDSSHSSSDEDDVIVAGRRDSKTAAKLLPRSVIESAEKALACKSGRGSLSGLTLGSSQSAKPGRRVFVESKARGGSSSDSRIVSASAGMQVTINRPATNVKDRLGRKVDALASDKLDDIKPYSVKDRLGPRPDEKEADSDKRDSSSNKKGGEKDRRTSNDNRGDVLSASKERDSKPEKMGKNSRTSSIEDSSSSYRKPDKTVSAKSSASATAQDSSERRRGGGDREQQESEKQGHESKPIKLRRDFGREESREDKQPREFRRRMDWSTRGAASSSSAVQPKKNVLNVLDRIPSRESATNPSESSKTGHTNESSSKSHNSSTNNSSSGQTKSNSVNPEKSKSSRSVDHKKFADRKLSVPDESNFEPDYEDDVPSDNERKPSRRQRHDSDSSAASSGDSGSDASSRESANRKRRRSSQDSAGSRHGAKKKSKKDKSDKKAESKKHKKHKQYKSN